MLRVMRRGLAVRVFTGRARCVFLAALAIVLSSSAPAAQTPPTPATPAATPAVPLDHGWTGAWMGTIASQPTNGKQGYTIPVSVVVRSASGTPGPGLEIAVTMLPAGALAKSAISVVSTETDLAFTLDSGGKQGRFEGSLADEGQSIRGSMTTLAPGGAAAQQVLIWSMRRVDLASELPNTKVYEGALEVAGSAVAMRLALGEGPHGWCGAMDVVSQGVRDLPVEVVKSAAGFTVHMPVGTIATMVLVPDAEMRVLEGSFSQGTFRGNIRFTHVEGAALAAARRPQEPKPPFPYTNADVRIEHPAGHTLGGTLTLPTSQQLARKGLVPAVVMVTGSGPQNRDEDLLGHKPFAVIADALARAGVAVLRYDDRGVDASTGTFAGATTLDLASDADIASQWLKRQPSIDPARVGMVGHSEGAMIAPIVALWQNAGDTPVSPLAFTVLLAPPAESGAATLARQTSKMYEVAALPPEKVVVAIVAHAEVMRAIEQYRDASALRPFVEALVRSQLALVEKPLPSDAELAPIIDGAMRQLTDPWMVEFIRFDPAPVLTRLEMPTLAMWGSKDVQVVVDANAPLLESIAAKSGAPVTARRYEGLNHLFQPATTGMPDEYGAIETTFDPKALAEMVAWVVETVTKGPAPQIPEATRAGFGEEVAALPPRLWLLKPVAATP